MTIDKLDPKGLEAAARDLISRGIGGLAEAGFAIKAYLAASTAGVPGETPRVTEAKPIGYAIADYFEDRRAEYEQNGTVIYAAPAGMATTPVYLSSPPVSQQAEAVNDPDEAYELGKRDGYSDAVQEIDRLTGGDGEYRYCTDRDPDRHTPDPASMISRIVDRFETLLEAKP